MFDYVVKCISLTINVEEVQSTVQLSGMSKSSYIKS